MPRRQSGRRAAAAFLRLKTLAVSAFSGYSIFAADHIYGIKMKQL